MQSFGRSLIQVAGWLICQQNRWFGDQRSGHRNPLLLAPESMGAVGQTIAKSKPLENGFGAPSATRPDSIRAMRSGISAFSSAVNSGRR